MRQNEAWDPTLKVPRRLASMGKRGRNEYLSLADGRASAKAILETLGGALLGEDSVTLLPYPGIGVPSGRPPFELRYIGNKALLDLLAEFVYGTPRLVIAGPRGFGKSADLRALSVYLYNTFYVDNSKDDVLVCIWNMAAAINDVAQVVRDALLFAYLVVVEGEKLRAAAAVGLGTDTSQQVEAEVVEVHNIASTSTDASERVTEFEKVLEEIQSIKCIEDAIRFIKGRKKENQEVFYFFVDGWELIDATDSAGVHLPRDKDRALVHRKLEQLFSEGKQVWFSASAKSNAVKPSSGELIYHKVKPFNDVQCKSYASSSIFGNLPSRQKDIDFYTGRVPLFLDVLCDCCTLFSSLLTATAWDSVHADLKSKAAESSAVLRQKFQSFKSVTSDKEIAELLQEDDNWQMVLKLFREHEEVKQVEDSIIKIKLDKSCHSIEEMGRKDATYFILQEQRYCSSFVHRLYVKGFRAKEAQFLKHAGGAWMPYCRYLLRQSSVNWSDVGWVVEDLVADVVTNRQVYFGTTLGNIAGAKLKLEEFTEIPQELQIEELLKTKPGSGWYWKPRLFNFPYVDGVICYTDMQGILHLIGLQVTVSVDQHLISARLFMSYEYLKRWLPDLEAHVAAGKLQLHFVYVGCSKTHKDAVFEQDIKAQVHRLRGGKCYGVAAHKWTFVPLAKALTALEGEEIEVVGDVAAQRQLQVPQWPLEMAALYLLKRTELNEIAQQYGLDPKQYSRKEDLVTALVAMV